VNSTTCRQELDELIENQELPEESKEAILHGNAEEFYRFKA
jgi:predicted TIM-barrel fold metal-dependent hydrolase